MSQSYQVLKEAIKPQGAKFVAESMGLSASILFKWSQSEYNSGSTPDPLQRVSELYEITGDDRIINHVCNAANGFFVKNATVEGEVDTELVKTTQVILTEFSEMLMAITEGRADGDISPDEAIRIRSEWEDMKRVTEGFVLGCESGQYRVKEVVK